MDIPTLRTARLILRGFREADLDAFADMQADAEVMRYLGAGPAAGKPRTRAETWGAMCGFMGMWALRGYGTWAVEDAASGAFIGRAGILHPLEWPEPELAYTLARPAWGRGYATEACAAARDWAFDTLGWERLASFVKRGNAASSRVLEKLGAVNEGETEVLGITCGLWVHYRPGRGPVA